MGKAQRRENSDFCNNPKLCNQHCITYCKETEALIGEKTKHCTRHLTCIIAFNPHSKSCEFSVIMFALQMN